MLQWRNVGPVLVTQAKRREDHSSRRNNMYRAPSLEERGHYGMGKAGIEQVPEDFLYRVLRACS